MSDGAAPGDIKKWREAEIKHGRVAMLASLGVLVAEVKKIQQRSNSVAESNMSRSWNISVCTNDLCVSCKPHVIAILIIRDQTLSRSLVSSFVGADNSTEPSWLSAVRAFGPDDTPSWREAGVRRSCLAKDILASVADCCVVHMPGDQNLCCAPTCQILSTCQIF